MHGFECYCGEYINVNQNNIYSCQECNTDYCEQCTRSILKDYETVGSDIQICPYCDPEEVNDILAHDADRIIRRMNEKIKHLDSKTKINFYQCLRNLANEELIELEFDIIDKRLN